jgi:isoleucyl-tRNA synthetase
VFHSAHNFCAVDLSAQYLDVIKDRLYTSAANDRARRAAQTTCYEILRSLACVLAPILTFTTEEVWRHLPGARAESIHLERFPEAPREWLDDALAAEWGRLLEVRREVAKALELARTARGGREQGGGIGSGLEALVRISRSPEDLPELLRRKRDLLPTLFIVSAVALEPSENPSLVHYESQEIPGLVIDIERAPGRKCERCWKWSERVGEHPEHPTLCERCVPVILGAAGLRTTR